MDPLSLILLSLQGLSVVLRNPALGGGSHVQLGQAADLLTSLADAVAQGEAGYAQLQQFTTAIQGMVAQNRGPSRQEWADLVARRDAALERLEAVKAQIAAGSQAPVPVPPAPPPETVSTPPVQEPTPGA